MLWLLFLVPVALVVLMVWLVAYARSGPPTAYGYALGNEPRRRRQVPASVIRLLTPLFAYNHHRDAYILRGIGNRRGPVLKVRGRGTVGREAGGGPARRGADRRTRREQAGEEPGPTAAAPVERCSARAQEATTGRGGREGPDRRPRARRPRREAQVHEAEVRQGQGGQEDQGGKGRQERQGQEDPGVAQDHQAQGSEARVRAFAHGRAERRALVAHRSLQARRGPTRREDRPATKTRK